VKTDKWYIHQPEWGTDESQKKAKAMTPGEKRDRQKVGEARKLKSIRIDMKKRAQDNERARQALKDPDHNPDWANSKSKVESLNKIRNVLYKGAKFLGDVNAVKKGKVGKRVARRAAGKATGKFLGKLFR